MTNELFQQWVELKATEKQAVEARRAVEDELVEILQINENATGTIVIENGDWKVKIVCRLTETIDQELLQSVAQEAAVYDQLSVLFRWKPEINKRAWDNAPEDVKNILAEAITTKASRPSFTISKEN